MSDSSGKGSEVSEVEASPAVPSGRGGSALTSAGTASGVEEHSWASYTEAPARKLKHWHTVSTERADDSGNT